MVNFNNFFTMNKLLNVLQILSNCRMPVSRKRWISYRYVHNFMFFNTRTGGGSENHTVWRGGGGGI